MPDRESPRRRIDYAAHCDASAAGQSTHHVVSPVANALSRRVEAYFGRVSASISGPFVGRSQALVAMGRIVSTLP